MRTTVLTIVLLFISGDRLFGQQLIWDKTRPLTFADFRGKPMTQLLLQRHFVESKQEYARGIFGLEKLP